MGTKLYKASQGTDFVGPIQVASADGAITIKSGCVMITKATAAALTLAAPTAGVDDGKQLTIIDTYGAAHTVTQTSPGFNAGSTSSDVGTFGGAKGDGLMLLAFQGVWLVLNNVNVTLA